MKITAHFFLFLITTNTLTLITATHHTQTRTATTRSRFGWISWGVIGAAVVGSTALYYILRTKKSNVAITGAKQANKIAYGTERSQKNISDTKKLLLKNPLEVLQRNFGTCFEFKRDPDYAQLAHEYHSQNLDIHTALSRFLLIIKRHEQQNSIFLLSECSNPGCSLNRGGYPLHRAQFEQAVSDALIEKLNSHKKPVSVTFFASGDIFECPIVLTKTVDQNPDALINLHLIDTQYANYIACRTRNENTVCKIDPSTCLDPVRAMDILKTNDTHTILHDCILPEIKFKQLLTFLTHGFPHAVINLYIHANTKAYLTNLAQHVLPHADVVATSDIDECDSPQEAQADYQQLCKATLQAKPTSRNFWLRPHENEENARIETITSVTDIPQTPPADIPVAE